MPPTPQAGEAAPQFDLPATNGRHVSLEAMKGRPFVLYFYPKPDTSGCTKQACAFGEILKSPELEGMTVIGVSRETLKKTEKFAQKYNLSFPLAADETGATCEAYGVWVEKSMYGRKYMGIERTTFLIDAQGVIAQVWNKVSVSGHAEAVAKAFRALEEQLSARG